MKLLRLLAISLVLAPFLFVVHANAACSINVTVKNVGTAPNDSNFYIDWAKSQYRGGGVWKKICYGGKKCTVEVKMGTSTDKTFHAESGSCDMTRSLKIYTQLGEDGGPPTYTIDCTIGAVTTTAVDVSAPFALPTKGVPVNPTCTSQPSNQ